MKNNLNSVKHDNIETLLLEHQILTSDQARIARIEHKKTGKRLEKLFVEMGFISEKTLSAFISEKVGIEHFSLSSTVIDAEAVKLLPKSFCERHKVLLLSLDATTAYLAMVDVHDIIAQDELKKLIKDYKIQPLIAPETELLRAIDIYFGYEMSIEGILKEIENGAALSNDGIEDAISPTVRFVNVIILDAVKKNASDIHFEPEGNLFRIRYRIDGLLTLVRTLHINYWPSICVRLKIMSAMNIADSRFPQNGRFSLHLGAREVDFRVSSLPIIYGENIVIRILDKSHSLLPMDRLGYGRENVELIKRVLKTPTGMIIITGPTGSGKTTSLYSMLNYINSPSVNIMTLEEPVEYQLPWIRQTEVKDPGGISFSKGVRSILRQDPDIIFIGEIRDEDTASMALRASMTGHQVFTTLHTNDVFGVVYRLQDLGLEPSILAGNMICAMAQRLLRKLCSACKIPSSLEHPMEAESLGVYVAKGCDRCHFTGYSGRTAVVEILHFTEALNDLISSRASRQEFKRVARENGFISLAEHGLLLVEKGITSMAEFERVLGVHT